MGQREDLLAGAKLCIAERGYSRTTARDIVAVSGANLAAIGYHFGSKEALLNAAVIDSFDEWASAIEDAIRGSGAGAPVDRFERFLHDLLDSAADRRATIVASVQAFGEAEFAPAIRAQLTASHAEGRRELAALLLGITRDEVDDVDEHLGALVLAIINGMILQWFITPEATPAAAQLADAIRRLAGIGVDKSAAADESAVAGKSAVADGAAGMST